mmetsp:Transcript_30037/g.69992  ORF Transcript_30037/g.69992 Transcript_30037/m.69992 type:complete len:717 (-) Transcript_30037:176-2326(-)
MEMEKRLAPKLELEPDPKRLRLSTEALAPNTLEGDLYKEVEYYFEQRFVGWIVGKGGSAAKQVEETYQVHLRVDQSTKDLGYSKLSISGAAAKVQEAAEAVNYSLTKAASTPGYTAEGPFLHEHPPAPGELDQSDGWYEAAPFDQKFIGWLIGRGGGVIRDIEQQTGCKIGIDQKTKHMGYAKAEIRGDQTQRAMAMAMLQESLEKAGGSILSWESLEANQGSYGGPSNGRPPTTSSITTAGKGQVNLSSLPPSASNALEKLGGVKGLTDVLSGLQALSPLLDLVKGDSSGEVGKLVTALKTIGGSTSGSSSKGSPAAAAPPADIRIEQKWVGWVLGKGGGVLREIETAVGTRIIVDQSTKHLGYSTIVVQDASPAQHGKVREMLQDWLQKAGGSLLNDKGGGKNGGSGKESYKGGAMADSRWYGSGGSSWQSSSGGSWQTNSAGTWHQKGYQDYSKQVKIEMHLEQKWVGWVLGRGGAVLREIEQVTGANVSIDQSTKNVGYSTVHIGGSESQVAHVQELIKDKLKLVNGSGDGLYNPNQAPPRTELAGAETVTIEIEQKWIGWIVGRSGQTVREMEAATGAQIAIDQSTKDLGYSVVKVSGPPSAVASVQEKIQASLATASARDTAPGDPSALGGLSGDGEPDMQVEQKFVGWLLGRGGSVLRELEERSGAKISIDQSTKESGYSSIHFAGDWGLCHTARQMVAEKLSAVSTMP